MRNTHWQWLVALCVVALLASACGGGGDGDNSGAAVEQTSVPTATGGDDSGDGEDSGDDGGDSAEDEQPDGQQSGTDDEGQPESTGAPSVPDEEEPPVGPEPVYGGTLVFGLDAETTGGWNPITTTAATSGHIVLRQIYDPLIIEGVDGEPIPFLLESFSPNEDYTEWTFTLRPGITFHDGSPVNSAALVRHMDEMGRGSLSRLAINDAAMQSAEAIDDLSVKVTLGRSFADFPLGFTSAGGFLPSPTMYDLGTDSARNPIGTGPFMLEDWAEHDVTRVVRNPNYWRTDAQGRQLPYLDAIEFRPIEDDETRFNTLRAGEVDASVDNSGRRVEQYREGFKTHWQDDRYSATTYVQMNTAKPPFDNLEFRRALAQCTDRQTLNAVIWDGQPPATGPFSPGTPGYLEDSGFPAYDPDAGRATFERLGAPRFDITTTTTTLDLLQAELLVSMWGDCGLDVDIVQLGQTEAVTQAVFGSFSTFIAVNHSGYSLAMERFWWHSAYGPPLPIPAINFGRVNDSRIDAALDEVITTDDDERQQELAEEVSRAFAEGVYNIWLYYSRWLVATQDYVNGIDNLTLPEGGEHPKVFLGRVFLAETWLDNR
ncbi:MAG: ABC transporter substrate-binding protein [bacterium]|nr:ABC transporter substrate-binding protein [bacterium]MCY3631885.1 ABC transporter substrate-binding protein [bacterium]